FSITEKEWQRENTKCGIYTDWANHYLAKSGHKRLIKDLQQDVTDGVLLAEIIQVVANEKIEDINGCPKNRSQMIENIDACLSFLAAKGINIQGLSAEEIRNGNLKAILGLFFSLSRYKQQQQQPQKQHPQHHPSQQPPTVFQQPGPPSQCPVGVQQQQMPASLQTQCQQPQQTAHHQLKAQPEMQSRWDLDFMHKSGDSAHAVPILCTSIYWTAYPCEGNGSKVSRI
uniref:Calponin-homology (CH) domain-containing protein n=1 Tax=Gopherus evgoodei TaxID=1825980 RepID=A0A8C4VJM6_9SAUR